MSELNARNAAAIANELVEITHQLDGLDRFQARLGECGRYWHRFLDPLRDALHDRVVALFTPREPNTMPVTVEPYSLKVLHVAGHDIDNPEIKAIHDAWLNRPGEGPDAGTAFTTITSLPEPMAAQIILELMQRLSRDRQQEIAALLASA